MSNIYKQQKARSQQKDCNLEYLWVFPKLVGNKQILTKISRGPEMYQLLYNNNKPVCLSCFLEWTIYCLRPTSESATI